MHFRDHRFAELFLTGYSQVQFSSSARNRGFSLLELSVVLVIIALLLGGLLVPLGAQVEQRQYAETEKQLLEIKEALMGFAVSNRYLPCPAVSSANGVEDRTGTSCNGGKRVGFLPWVTLGVKPSDSWGNLFRYSVTPAFTVSDPANLFTLDEASDATWITIRTRNSSGAVDLSIPDGIPAAVLSHGKNGYGATSDTGIARALPGTWDNTQDEFQNANNTDLFWSRTRADNAAVTGGPFDGIVVWISPKILFSRMVAAGRLP